MSSWLVDKRETGVGVEVEEAAVVVVAGGCIVSLGLVLSIHHR